MLELNKPQFYKAAELFHQTSYGALAFGTLEGQHPGRVFVDSVDSPTVSLICTTVGYYFLAGVPSDGMTNWLYSAFHADFAPRQLAEICDSQFLLFYDRTEWQEPLLNVFSGDHSLHITKKRLTRPQDALTQKRKKSLPSGIEIVQVTKELLNQHLEKAGEATLFWGSIEACTEQGLGYWAMDGRTLAASCDAVFIGRQEVEISIATDPTYRRKGLAFATATVFLNACAARGLHPVWGCWTENLPSLTLAHMLGFDTCIDQDICFFTIEQSPG